MNRSNKKPPVGTECSLVIPVYNGEATIAPLVEKIHRVFDGVRFEVVLVNDGSSDHTAETCARLLELHPETVTVVELARNFGEHNAVLAGLNHAMGEFVCVLDDDGQNPPEEALRLFQEIKGNRYDVVYGRYRVKQHGWSRNLGSWFADRMANVMLKKPRGLYLSSFKVMNRFAVDQVTKYHGPYPYVDGLIYRSTSNIGQIDVEHLPRMSGKSNYTFGKLVRIWLNMFLNYSILPLRVATWVGLLTSLSSIVMLALVWIEKLQTEPDPKPGFRTVLCCICFFGGLNLLIAGILGEYLGRLYLDHTGTPQFVVRHVRRGDRSGSVPSETEPRVSDADLEIAGLAATATANRAIEQSGEQSRVLPRRENLGPGTRSSVLGNEVPSTT